MKAIQLGNNECEDIECEVIGLKAVDCEINEDMEENAYAEHLDQESFSCYVTVDEKPNEVNWRFYNSNDQNIEKGKRLFGYNCR